MNITINTDLVKRYGIIEAVILDHIRFWVQHNASEGINRRDDRTWTYFTIQGLYNTLDGCFSIGQIRGAIKRLMEAGVLTKGYYFDNARNRTTWYAFADESEFGIVYPAVPDNRQKSKVESRKSKVESRKTQEADSFCFANSANAFAENDKCIYKDISKKDNNSVPPKGETLSAAVKKAETDFEEFRRQYKGTKRGLQVELDAFRRKYPKRWMVIASILLPSYLKQEAVKDRLRAAGRFVPQPKNLKTYLAQACWEEEIMIPADLDAPATSRPVYTSTPQNNPLAAPVATYDQLPAGRIVL